MTPANLAADSATYTRPEPTVFTSKATFASTTSQDTFQKKNAKQGTYLHHATLRLTGRLNPSKTPGTTPAAAPEAKALTAKDPSRMDGQKPMDRPGGTARMCSAR